VGKIFYKELESGAQPVGVDYIEGAFIAGIQLDCTTNDQAIFHNIEQNTKEWHKLRAGRITSSSFAKIMAHGEKKFGKPAVEYAIQLATEKRFGYQEKPRFYNEDMARGHEQEADAIKAYEKKTGNKVTNGGIFIAGALADSPDGIAQDPTMTSKGLLEIKSVIVSTQDKTILKNDIDPSYKWQVMFHLWVTGYEWIDYVSYSPEHETPLFIKRVYRCDETIEEMRKYIIEFQKIVNLQSELIEDSIKLFRKK
jgi:putative phage-type endonuclease